MSDFFIEMYTDLPDAGEPDAQHAQDRLDRIIEEQLNVVYVLLENDKGIKRMREVAIGVAAAKPNVRRVVEADPKTLTPAKLKEIRGSSPHNVAAVYGLNDTVVVRLRSGDAKRKLKVIASFAKAEAQFGQGAG